MSTNKTPRLQLPYPGDVPINAADIEDIAWELIPHLDDPPFRQTFYTTSFGSGWTGFVRVHRDQQMVVLNAEITRNAANVDGGGNDGQYALLATFPKIFSPPARIRGHGYNILPRHSYAQPVRWFSSPYSIMPATTGDNVEFRIHRARQTETYNYNITWITNIPLGGL